MKTLIVAVVVLLVVSQSEALECICGGLRRCSGPVETCYDSETVCASVIHSVGGRTRSTQSCMKERDCRMINRLGASSAYCCYTDRCNR
ncbi:unnamed protein product [Ophioblennius macclurei]